MRKEINDAEMEKVAGGTVFISRDYMQVAFSSSKEVFKLQNCEYKDARNLADDLWEANKTLGDAEFDALVQNELRAKGWIK